MTRTLLTILLLCTAFMANCSDLIYSSPAEKTYVDTSCCKICTLSNGESVYQVAYITIYTAVQANGTKKAIYIQQYNKTWTQTRIIHQQYYDVSGKLLSYSDAIGDWFIINNQSIGATMRNTVKKYF